MFFRVIILGLLTLVLAACNHNDDSDDASSAGSVGQQASPGSVADVPAPGGQVGASTRDCFWSITIDDAAVNTLYPDIYAKYWVAVLPILPGTNLSLEGLYPHARYMSFNLYDPAFRPVDALADRVIAPQPGSTNPFVAGADRLGEARDYSVNVIAEVPPENVAERLPNTLYAHLPLGEAGVASSVPYAILIYRIYVPDTGTDRAGDVPLPRVTYLDAQGNVFQGPEACEQLEPFVPSELNDQITNAPFSLPIPAGFGASADLMWLKFFGLVSSTENRFNATPLRDPLHAALPNPNSNSGGFASNVDNNYVYAPLNQDLGPLAVFEATMPMTPHTVAGDPVMGEGEMRYWSVCTYEIASQRYYDCLYDENSQLDADHRGVFLVGREADRPSNATAECGVNWLPWGPVQTSLLIMRHMLPEEDFPHSIQKIPSPPGSCEAPVMGEYFPYGHHLSKEAFEALGCPVMADAIADRATQFDASEDCPQQPTGEVESLGAP